MEFFELGKITKLHGYKGELTVWLDLDSPEFISELAFVFLEQGGRQIPFEILKYSHKKDKVYRLQLGNVVDDKQARSLVGKVISIPLEQADKVANTSNILDDLPGYLIIDKNEGELGEIHMISSPNSNPLIVIQKDYKEILIPFSQDIIVQIDQKKKRITVDCPPGLLDLYR